MITNEWNERMIDGVGVHFRHELSIVSSDPWFYHVLAAKEWETIVKTPGIVQLSASAPFARLQTARLYASNSSARTQALTAYQDFLSLWQNAEADISLLKQARTEYSKLRSGS
jgi:hypothetical protein